MKPDALALVAAAEASSQLFPPYLHQHQPQHAAQLLKIRSQIFSGRRKRSSSNTSDSSSGSGSGDFHQYRQKRRKEQDRLARLHADYQKRKAVVEFNARREERLKAAEERTAKKRLKLQKKKQRKKGRLKWHKGRMMIITITRKNLLVRKIQEMVMNFRGVDIDMIMV